MINYQNLQDSIEHYASLDYKRIESPWTVNPDVAAITKPENIEDPILSGKNKCLVASGEQSFLYLCAKGFLPPGKYQTVTPCFRFYDSFSFDHAKYFMKNELIIVDSKSKEYLLSMISHAKSFFSKKLYHYSKFKIISNSGEDFSCMSFGDYSYAEMVNNMIFDIEIELFSGEVLELGSYGFRRHGPLSWIFGTGVAEPRLSYIQEAISNGVS